MFETWGVINGDCREVLATLDAESVDAIACRRIALGLVESTP